VLHVLFHRYDDDDDDDKVVDDNDDDGDRDDVDITIVVNPVLIIFILFVYCNIYRMLLILINESL
jgi:hypothetical protein